MIGITLPSLATLSPLLLASDSLPSHSSIRHTKLSNRINRITLDPLYPPLDPKKASPLLSFIPRLQATRSISETCLPHLQAVLRSIQIRAIAQVDMGIGDRSRVNRWWMIHCSMPSGAVGPTKAWEGLTSLVRP